MSDKNIEILEADLKTKENQEIKDFGMATLGTIAQQEILKMIKQNSRINKTPLNEKSLSNDG